ncbi:MAG: N-acetylglucosamine-6-phosphate deacetylase [Clostridia bacterium]|nr:N-acetylglucosamine-6-phosphate deacetylase [Clostridia bacterium]
MQGFKNANVYVENLGIVKTNVAVKNGKIFAIGKDVKIDNPYPYKKGEIVFPAFIDEHIHGAMGYDFMDADSTALDSITNAIAKEGTVSVVATTMTASLPDIENAIVSIKDYMAKPNGGARILGTHLEGPFISETFKGAQNLKHILDPDISVYKNLNKKSKKTVKIITVAPEEKNAKDLIKQIVKDNIIASAGHSDAGVKDIEQAKKCGLNSITHTFNAMRGIHHREIGISGMALLDDDLYTEVIADLIHLSSPMLKLILKNKPKDKIILITDSMRAKFLPDGESELGGQKVIVKNGEARLINGTLAGSTLKMNQAIKNLLSLNVKITDAIDYATINVAKHLNLDKKIGSIKKGKLADFCVLDKDINVKLTIKEGKIIYKA